ncbi:NAD(P)/FAD-dependent oxidoreductase [Tsuneonella troitsensis]|uniref:NAD(P)/FAD-dependent oxidoreductase n=1 Tax=Tsuneonella troitsensis TaxID=292222 RepID=UPI00070F86C9|nr:NAD(P)/FAD-dependent oxidoreductase [Tsuneonella troitsensis]
MSDLDVLVIGAGVVGLAAARALALAGREVVVVDRHGAFGTETSSRNSEVVHAGIYYPPGSLKARMCVAGRDALYRYAAERDIALKRCGKIIVANGDAGKSGLEAIAARAKASLAGPLDTLDRAAIAKLEPEVTAEFGLLSPLTGIIDSHALMLSYLGDLENAGGAFARNTNVRAIDRGPDGFIVEMDAGATLAVGHIVNAGGLRSDAIARSIAPLGDAFKPTLRYARGVYFKALNAPRFRRLVYPLPTEASLGTHATIDLTGAVRFGPDVEWITDPDDYHVDPHRAEQFAQGIADYWPAVDPSLLVPDYAGIRPKLVGPGQPPADFRIDGPADHGIAGLVSLHGIESPGLTASLPLGDLVARRIFEPPLAP